MFPKLKSLQFQLALRVTAFYAIAAAIVVAVLIIRSYDIDATLDRRNLSIRAENLAAYVSRDATGTLRLDLPARLEAVYTSTSSADIYAIRGPDHRVIAAVPPAFGAMTAKWPDAADTPTYFHLEGFGDGALDYYGLSQREPSAVGPLSISVARAATAYVLVFPLLREFVLDYAWIVPVFLLATLAIGIFAVRNGLKKVRHVSEMASAIGPHATSIRLPIENLPSEITPLVAAVNHAFDRLEQGFAVQRRFTANAAHELRTPLGIVTAALDTMEADSKLTKLKSDVARMNRLVEQLLSVARLDAVALDVSGTVNLNAVAADTVATLAPLAIARDRTVALNAPEERVEVKGNAHAITDALRNLVENALVHSPPATEVTVSTHSDGSVSVADEGPGIVPEDRERIFDRFWRGRSPSAPGAGLGLPIVKEIMKAHAGSVTVENRPTGGALFTLRFPIDKARPPQSSGA
jgi:signal transduction histidine kinase